MWGFVFYLLILWIRLVFFSLTSVCLDVVGWKSSRKFHLAHKQTYISCFSKVFMNLINISWHLSVLFIHLTFWFAVEDIKINPVGPSPCVKQPWKSRWLCDICYIVFPIDCEHLIRRMLVLDPSKRLTIAQIKEHKWMLIEVPVQRPVLYPQEQENEPSIGEFNEQVLRLMHSLGIDQQKTIEVKYQRFD